MKRRVRLQFEPGTANACRCPVVDCNRARRPGSDYCQECQTICLPYHRRKARQRRVLRFVMWAGLALAGASVLARASGWW